MSAQARRGHWLLLIHHLPKEPAYLRVKIGRRLARVGAVALKNSVYLLPATDSAAEDFQWIRGEIVAGGGTATVVEAELLEGLTDSDAEAMFREAKDAEYAGVIRDARELRAEPWRRRKRGLSDDERAAAIAEIVRLERRVEEIAATDFFGASGREVVTGILRERRRKVEPSASAPARVSSAPRGRTWVTRTGIHVDRIASAWLIRRFIDPNATFKYVHHKGYVPLDGELRFDMFEAEFSHEGDNCTFETLLGRFDVGEPGVRAIAEIVHDIDLKEDKFGRPETVGVAACIAGLCRVSGDDHERLARGSALFEALLAHLSSRRKETR